MTIDIPTPEDFAELTKARHAASVSVYIASTFNGGSGTRAPLAVDTEAARLALRSAINGAVAQLKEIGVDTADRDRILQAAQRFDVDRDLWATQARTLAVFISPETARTFAVMNELPQHTAVGDRFDVGPLIRAVTFSHRGYVLAVTEGDVRLLQLQSNASSRKVELADLPADAADALDRSVTTGRFDRHRAAGTLGPKAEQRRYCSIVQDAVLAAIGEQSDPLVLAAAADLEPAYREINTYPNLLATGIDANPTSLTEADLESRGRAVLDQYFAKELAQWHEKFGSLRSNGRASAQLSEIARAATAGLVDTLLFDLESTDEGEIDDAGVVTFAESAGPTTYGLIDEIAARVLRSGGTVRAVRRADLPDDSPVAATLRFTA